ncbi:Rne/Rng family ribonuclease [Aureimonas psammosilenae]|uniref:Rne/Rng family ribonuclease n=1 Tax=Aureimonas psammosilenae TaxID=2495496 RepID=UPI0012605983|nr:ribonuclease E/G [Aureimonas psammosilenae]
MANKMLIDASHPEETRVVVLKGNRIEEFDFESEHKKQIKGNIYLAKVTRVEPSLQAAFVEYGGNRHGFLAFSEIHPDYYQIPAADRQALVEEDLIRAKEEEEQEERKFSQERSRPAAPARKSNATPAEDSVSEAVETDEPRENGDGSESEETSEEGTEGAIDAQGDITETTIDVEALTQDVSDESTSVDETGEAMDGETSSDEDGAEGNEEETASESEEPAPRRSRRGRSRRRGNGAEDDLPGEEEEEVVEELGSQDAMEEVPTRAPRPPRKQYKIQEVIKRRQILLVQVVKEERGNKGAALTTYLSLAGRYSVLMPNTARGGGISRKITNVADRKRLKEVVRDLEVPRGMGIILRTAGAMRTKPEVKRDYEYLMRLWETVRTVTLSSMAPALVYEEGSLIKRSIRDLYNKDIDQILVSGEDGYREAKDFMRMLLPSQAKVVQPYREAGAIFSRGGIEAQLDRMLQPHVTLKSGGYIILNQTEALVSIDVNSGRSTREHSVEDTALQTNLEAAEEIARQLRLRDLAGLIVIDFIDMEEKRNNRAVEKKIKDCLKDDRARIQVGRISHFGLLEMSRQRIRASVLESTTKVCPTCAGMGFIRSDSSLALHVVRAIEEYLQKQSTHDIVVKVPTGTALYVLNEKRRTIDEIERMYGLRILLQADDTHGHQHVAIEQGAEAAPRPVKAEVVSPLTVIPDELEPEVIADEPLDEEVAPEAEDERSEEGGRRRRRRRRGRKGSETENGSDENETAEENGETETASESTDEEETAENANASDEDEGNGRKRRRRGRRGGNRRTREEEAASPEHGLDAAFPNAVTETQPDAEEQVSDEAGLSEAEPVREIAAAETTSEAVSEFPSEPAPEATEVSEEAPLASEAIAPVVAEPAVEAEHEAPATEPVEEQSEAQIAAEPVEAEPVAEEAPKREELLEPLVTSSDAQEDGGEPKPKRTGWWSRRS